MKCSLTVIICTCLWGLFLTGCGESRVHILPDVQNINRVAVINLPNPNGSPMPDSEFFTNEFVSVGFSVVERGHLQDVIKEAFTQTGYLDERSVAQWGKGLGIEAVVLHQISSNLPSEKDPDINDVIGWVRMVDVETGKIVMTYNVEVRTATGRNATRAAKAYSEKVVDDLKAAMKQQKMQPGTAPRVQVQQVQQIQVQQEAPPRTAPTTGK